MSCPARDQLAQLDWIELAVNSRLGVGEEVIAGPTIGVLSVNEQREAQGRGHGKGARKGKNRPCSSAWPKPRRLQGRLQ